MSILDKIDRKEKNYVLSHSNGGSFLILDIGSLVELKNEMGQSFEDTLEFYNGLRLATVETLDTVIEIR